MFSVAARSTFFLGGIVISDARRLDGGSLLKTSGEIDQIVSVLWTNDSLE